MKKPCLLMLSIFCNLMIGNAFAAATLPTDVPTKVATYTYFTAARSQSLEQWVNTLNLSPAHKKEVQAHLKGHSIGTAAMPEMKWTEGTSVVTINSGTSSYLVGFAGIEK